MNTTLLPILFLLFSLATLQVVGQPKEEEAKSTIKKIYDTALSEGQSYQMLDYLSNQIGGRLSGSPQAAAAVEWAAHQMKALGFDTVYLQPVMVPHWVRGKQEIGRIVNSKKMGTVEVNVTALGNSVGTGEAGIYGQVVEVQNFDELKELGKEKIEGKIVFYNRPMDPTLLSTSSAYGGAAIQRTKGASEAAKYGAIGTVVRSLTTNLDDYPHTGTMRYDLNVPKIPAIAISTMDANLLSKLLKDDAGLTFYMETHSKMLPDVLSYNVIGEMGGSEYPEKVIVVGGHLDSWDLGDGSHDDGAGVVHSIEALRLLKEVGVKPKHTLRTVLFMNEENGLRGGLEYAKVSEDNKTEHVAAIESDSGGFLPVGFSVDGPAKELKKMKGWEAWLEPFGIYWIKPGGGGADIGPLKQQGVTLLGLRPDGQRYFRHHHTSIDTFEHVNQRELELGAAAMASMVYLIDQFGLN